MRKTFTLTFKDGPPSAAGHECTIKAEPGQAEKVAAKTDEVLRLIEELPPAKAADAIAREMLRRG